MSVDPGAREPVQLGEAMAAVGRELGIPAPDAASFSCSSSPVIPGIRMSVTRQATFARTGDPRKLCAFANVDVE